MSNLDVMMEQYGGTPVVVVLSLLVGMVVTIGVMRMFSSTSSSSAKSSSTSLNKKKKKKKRSNNKAASAAVAVEEEEEENKVLSQPPPPVPSKKKKKNKAQSTATATTKEEEESTTPVVATAAAPTTQVTLADYEDTTTPRQKQQHEEAWETIPTTTKSKKKKPKATPSTAPTTTTSSTTTKLPVGGSKATTTTTTPSPPTIEEKKEDTSASSVISKVLSIDAQKVGIIIGPKGATLQAIQAATGCQVDVSSSSNTAGASRTTKATVTLTHDQGDISSLQRAALAIQELSTKGYAKLLQPEGFKESQFEVKDPKFLAEIVGPKGQTIQAIQSTCQVKLTIPKTTPTTLTNSSKKPPIYKVGIAGDKANIQHAKQVLRELQEYHHSEITHPGFVHSEVEIPSEFRRCIIGVRGSEIKHIRGNFKVNVYLPNDNDAFFFGGQQRSTTLVVGLPANVTKAIAYMQKLQDRESEQRAQKYNDEYY